MFDGELLGLAGLCVMSSVAFGLDAALSAPTGRLVVQRASSRTTCTSFCIFKLALSTLLFTFSTALLLYSLLNTLS